jgi:hypothetical protein
VGHIGFYFVSWFGPSVWACPTVWSAGLLYKGAGRLGFRGVQLFSLKLLCAPPCIIPPGKRRCRVYQIYCCEGSCVHQGLSCSGLRRVDYLHVACWIRSSSLGEVLHVIGRFLSR